MAPGQKAGPGDRPGQQIPLSRFVSRVKVQITAISNAIDQFFIPDAYSGPVELKMAA